MDGKEMLLFSLSLDLWSSSSLSFPLLSSASLSLCLLSLTRALIIREKEVINLSWFYVRIRRFPRELLPK